MSASCVPAWLLVDDVGCHANIIDYERPLLYLLHLFYIGKTEYDEESM